MRTDDEQQVFQQITGAFDEPAFIRRARDTENAWIFLLDRARSQRAEWLKIPGLRLGRLAKLAPEFRQCDRYLTADSISELRDLHQQWAPQLRVAVAATTRDSQVKRAVRELVKAFERFNHRWSKYVADLDYQYVNDMRTSYNKWYVIEKECALQSRQTATTGFQPLDMVSQNDVTLLLPCLNVPQAAT